MDEATIKGLIILAIYTGFLFVMMFWNRPKRRGEDE